MTPDQCQYLRNYAPTPPLVQQKSTNNKLGLMLGYGRGRWAIAWILTLILDTYSVHVHCIS